MEEPRRTKTTIGEDLDRLLAAWPAVALLPSDAPSRHAWWLWKRAIIDQVRLLELRDEQLTGDPYLWITEQLGDQGASVENRT